MNWAKKLSCFLIILSALSFCGGDAYAQNIFKGDFLKTGGKFGVWVQKQAENFEQAMKEIAESQFATFIGKGIDAAKKGMAYIQEKLKVVKAVIKGVQKTIDDVKNSTAVKVAMLSAQVASETAVLANIEKERETEVASIKSEMEMQKVTLQEKIKIAKDNHAISIKVLEEEFAELKTEEEKDAKRKEIAQYQKTDSEAIASLEEMLDDMEEEAKDTLKDVNKNYASMIAAQSVIIANLGIEIADLIDQEKRKKGEMETDPEKVTEAAVDEFSFREDEVITLDKREKKEKKRRRKRETAATVSSTYSADIIGSTEEIKSDEAGASMVSGTTNGKSEALQTAIQETAVQMETIYKYMILELKAIEQETANIMAENSLYKVGEVKAGIDICDYTVEKKSLLDFVGDVKDGIQKASDKVAEVTAKVQDGIQKVNDAVSTVTAGVGAVVATGQAISSAIENHQGKQSGNDDISGLEGM